jgi:hypothetical protein
MPWRHMGSGCIDPHFLDLGISWRWVVSSTLWPLYPRGKSPRYPLDRRLGGTQSRSGRHGEEKILDSTRTRTLTPASCPAHIQLLYWLWYPGSYTMKYRNMYVESKYAVVQNLRNKDAQALSRLLYRTGTKEGSCMNSWKPWNRDRNTQSIYNLQNIFIFVMLSNILQ